MRQLPLPGVTKTGRPTGVSCSSRSCNNNEIVGTKIPRWQAVETPAPEFGKPFIFRLTSCDGDISIEVTDLDHAWQETLDRTALATRGKECGCVADLNGSAQISAFAENLRKWLPRAKYALATSGQLQINVKEKLRGMQTELQWQFRANQLDTRESLELTQAISRSLFGVIESLGSELKSAKEVVREKSFHIRSMSDALARSAEYVPRRYQRSFSTSFTETREHDLKALPEESVDTWSSVNLAAQYWQAPASQPEPSQRQSQPQSQPQSQYHPFSILASEPNMLPSEPSQQTQEIGLPSSQPSQVPVQLGSTQADTPLASSPPPSDPVQPPSSPRKVSEAERLERRRQLQPKGTAKKRRRF